MCLRVLDKHSETVTSLAWLPDGLGIPFRCSGSKNHTLGQLNSRPHSSARRLTLQCTGRRRKRAGFLGHNCHRITSLAITPDFTRIVTVGMDYISNTPSGSSRGSSRRSGEFATTNPTGNGGNPAHGPGQVSDNWLITYDFATKQVESYVSSSSSPPFSRSRCGVLSQIPPSPLLVRTNFNSIYSFLDPCDLKAKSQVSRYPKTRSMR